MDNKKELNLEELAQVSGGWTYDGVADWLKGFEIACPYCGNSSRDVAQFQFMSFSKSNVYFRCVNCKREFIYSALAPKKGQILLLDDNQKTIKRFNMNN